jgi:hypothetical protein|tara:strand:+ start:1401 stop:1700 length:300 start_codon:yes stop_codon:yes gene_type:complete
MNETAILTNKAEDRIFQLIWEEFGDGETDGCLCSELDESLWTDEGHHPWDGLLYGYELETRCTYRQTLESPAEYETRGRFWITDEKGKELAEIDAGEFQ